MNRQTPLAALAAGWLMLVMGIPAFGQGGGIPMLTDNPGTPPKGHWEIDVAAILERMHTEWILTAPWAEVNYGLKDNLQLSYSTSLVTRDAEDQGPVSGWGNSHGGVKWRFLEQEQAGFSMAIYPQVDVNNPGHAARRAIVSEGTSLYLPIQVERQLGRWSLGGDAGYLFTEGSDDDTVLCGLVAGYLISSRIDVAGEIRLDLPLREWDYQTFVNFGVRYHLSEEVHLLGAVGHTLHEFEGDDSRLILFVGVQWTF